MSDNQEVTGSAEEWVALAHDAEAHPDDPHRWLLLAEALIAGGEFVRARNILRSQRELAGQTAPTAARLCRAWIAADDLTGALAASRQWLKIAADDPRAHAQLADILARHGDPAAACIRLRAGLSLFPEDLQLRMQFAEVLADREHWHEARLETERVMAAGETGTQAFALLARVYGALGLSHERLVALRLAVAAPDRDPTATLDLARELADTGAGRESLGLLEQTAQDAVGDYDVMIEVGRSFAQIGAVDRAKATFQRLAEEHPDQLEAHLELGRLHRSEGDAEAAVEALGRALQIEPNSAEASWEIGLAHRDANQPRQAAGALIKAAAAHPDNENIQEVLTETLQSLRPSTADIPPPTPKDSNSGFSGDLSVFSLPELLEFLVHQRASGELSVLNESSAWIVLELHEGNLAGARGSHAPILFAWVLERFPGLGPSFERISVQLDPSASDRHTVETLLEHGVPKATLQNLLEERALHALQYLMSWTEGRLRFDRLTQHEKAPALSVETRWAMLETVRLADEQRPEARL